MRKACDSPRSKLGVRWPAARSRSFARAVAWGMWPAVTTRSGVCVALREGAALRSREAAGGRPPARARATTDPRPRRPSTGQGGQASSAFRGNRGAETNRLLRVADHPAGDLSNGAGARQAVPRTAALVSGGDLEAGGARVSQGNGGGPGRTRFSAKQLQRYQRLSGSSTEGCYALLTTRTSQV